MELQIQDLVTSIRKEGVEAARVEADQIIAEARKKADAIVEEAKAAAQKTVEDATREINILRQSAQVSAQQAKRDAMLSLKKDVQDSLGKLLRQDVAKTVSADAELARLILAAIEGQDPSALSVEVAKVSENLKAQLASQMKKGLVLKPVQDLEAGFRVVAKDGTGFLDCSDEELASIVSHFMGDINI